MIWWRRDRDSNPGNPCRLNGFRDRPIRPLWHLSATGFVKPWAHLRNARRRHNSKCPKPGPEPGGIGDPAWNPPRLVLTMGHATAKPTRRSDVQVLDPADVVDSQRPSAGCRRSRADQRSGSGAGTAGNHRSNATLRTPSISVILTITS